MLPSTAASTPSGRSGGCREHIHAALNRNLCSVQIGIVGVYQLAASVSDIFGSSGNGFPVSTDVAFQLILIARIRLTVGKAEVERKCSGRRRSTT